MSLPTPTQVLESFSPRSQTAIRKCAADCGLTVPEVLLLAAHEYVHSDLRRLHGGSNN